MSNKQNNNLNIARIVPVYALIEKMNVKTSMHYKIRDFLRSLTQFDFNYISEYDSKVNEKVCTVCFELLNNFIQSRSLKKFNSKKILHYLHTKNIIKYFLNIKTP